MTGSPPKAGGAAGAGEHAGRGDFMAAGGAEKPVFTVAALRFGQSLFLFTFGALAIHFSIFDVFGKKESASGAFRGVTLAVLSSAALHRTDEDRLAIAAPVFPFFHFLADRTFFHIAALFAQSSCF